MHTRAHGVDLHVRVDGPDDAPVLLCLHSLATDGDVWQQQMDALLPHFRVVRPDFRGHGASSATPPPYSLDVLRDDVLAVMDDLGIGRASVMGVSLGAIIAMALALDAPERVERIVVADCRADAPDAYRAMWDSSIATIEAHGLGPVIDSSVERWFSAPFRAARPELVDEVRARALGTATDGFIGCARAVQGLGYLPRLGEIGAPTLFVVGSEDPAAPVAVMADMAGRVPGAELVVLEGAGHLTPLEAGAAFTDAVLPFLTAAPSAS